uniref:Uncharacterized protein n=1 Tax=Rhabditophanes sp. KR3021 TaxID=114890 RepID=A0AC35UCY0_9BILA
MSNLNDELSLEKDLLPATLKPKRKHKKKGRKNKKIQISTTDKPIYNFDVVTIQTTTIRRIEPVSVISLFSIISVFGILLLVILGLTHCFYNRRARRTVGNLNFNKAIAEAFPAQSLLKSKANEEKRKGSSKKPEQPNQTIRHPSKLLL